MLNHIFHFIFKYCNTKCFVALDIGFLPDKMLMEIMLPYFLASHENDDVYPPLPSKSVSDIIFEIFIYSKQMLCCYSSYCCSIN